MPVYSMCVSVTVWVPEFVLACPCVCVCVGHVAERALSLFALRGYGAQNEKMRWFVKRGTDWYRNRSNRIVRVCICVWFEGERCRIERILVLGFRENQGLEAAGGREGS